VKKDDKQLKGPHQEPEGLKESGNGHESSDPRGRYGQQIDSDVEDI
jgi:hypothetical protein